MTLWEKTKIITESYADPEMASKYLGLWKGEVYEFAAVFLLLNKGLSSFSSYRYGQPFGSQANITGGKYPPAGVITDGFGSTLLINNKGIFRTSAEGDIYEPLPGGKGRRHVTYIEVNCSAQQLMQILLR
jgi:hypothetical protein